MKLDPSELDDIAERLARRLLPILREQLRELARPADAGENGGLLSVHELSERLGLSENTIRARVKTGEFPALRSGRRVLFDLATVREAMQPPGADPD